MSTAEKVSDQFNRALAGDMAALKLLLASTYERVAARIDHHIPMALRRVVDRDDLLQDAYVEVVRGLARFQNLGRAAFVRWVSVIALNRLRNVIRAHRALRRGGGNGLARLHRGPDESTIALLDVVAGSSWTASRFAAQAEAVAAVREAIDTLPPRYRQVVSAVYIAGQSIADVAREIGRTDRAVHGMCRRGLRLLRDLLRSGSRFLTSSA